ncbi:MAG TPA: hypothetical protein DD405_00215 [Desulfobacteraceae bacterium]|nr:hypothetical protein [Desulfobacteraceae bacterium]
MTPHHRSVSLGLLLLFLLFCLLLPLPLPGAILYKSYIVQKDRGKDILCCTHTVQPDECIHKILRQKGEISENNYPDFLRIFKNINPGIDDINLISPNQSILIPLKKISPDSFPGQSTGLVIIPFVTVSNRPELIKKYSLPYKIRPGDNISTIISKKYGAVGTKSYAEAIKLLKIINPGIKNINIIYAGKTIYLPVPPPFPYLSKIASILDAELRVKGLFHFPRKGKKDLLLDISRFPVIQLQNGTKILCLIKNKLDKNDKEVIESHWPNLRIISVPPANTGGKNIESVLNSLTNKKDNDSKNSITYSDNGILINITADIILPKPALTADEKDCRICLFFIDNNKKKTDALIVDYLDLHNLIIKDILRKNTDSAIDESELSFVKIKKKHINLSSTDQRPFAKEILSGMGYDFYPDISISFPYAGIRIKAVSNLIPMENGFPLLVDYANFYGNTAAAIKKAGFDIIHIKREDNYSAITKKLLTAMGIPHEKNPVFSGAKRDSSKNISITLPGFISTSKNNKKNFITFTMIPEKIELFLAKRNIQIIEFKINR